MKEEDYKKKILSVYSINEIKNIWETETKTIPITWFYIILERWVEIAATESDCFDVWIESREYDSRIGLMSFKKYLSFLDKEKKSRIQKSKLKHHEPGYFEKNLQWYFL